MGLCFFCFFLQEPLAARLHDLDHLILIDDPHLLIRRSLDDPGKDRNVFDALENTKVF